ncbi:hypothetical protein AC249_AIPGENE12273 [Exaiptasia diaphana]|nr:hypothetical protein AC249_AIPGENE12273 [Exaiptasia diaphana]
MATRGLPDPRKRTMTAKGLEYELDNKRKSTRKKDKDFINQISTLESFKNVNESRKILAHLTSELEVIIEAYSEIAILCNDPIEANDIEERKKYLRYIWQTAHDKARVNTTGIKHAQSDIMSRHSKSSSSSINKSLLDIKAKRAALQEKSKYVSAIAEHKAKLQQLEIRQELEEMRATEEVYQNALMEEGDLEVRLGPFAPIDEHYIMSTFMQHDFDNQEQPTSTPITTGIPTVLSTPTSSRPPIKPRTIITPQPKPRSTGSPVTITRGNPGMPVYTDHPAAPTTGNQVKAPTTGNQVKAPTTGNQFKFNVPSASHMGGTWERQIRTVRTVLSSLLKTQGTQLDDEGLRTLFVETENIVNSRPLTVQNMSEPDSEEVISPNHLLTLKSRTVQPPPGVFLPPDVYSRKRWRRVQCLSEQFWRTWHKEYCHLLTKRQKWIKPERNSKVGDIVLLCDEDLPRISWPLAKIVKVYPSTDGLVRKVQILLTRNNRRSYLDRPIHKLILIQEASPG